MMTMSRPWHLRDSWQFIECGGCLRDTSTTLRNLSARRFKDLGVVVVPTWDSRSWMTYPVQLLFADMHIELTSILSSAAVISKCRAAPWSAEVWMSISS